MSKQTTALVSLAFLLLVAVTAFAQPKLVGEPSEVDFGFVGIEFKVFHDFLLINNGTRLVKLKSVHVPCDCSSAWLSDSVVQTGDTVRVRLTFDTKDMFGKTDKTFSIYTDDPEVKEVRYAYRSIVGQWMRGLKPEPLSLFFLPAHKVKPLSIRNYLFDRIRVAAVDQADTLYTVKVIKPEALRNEAIQSEAAISPSVHAGTYLSSFRVHIATSDGNSPVILSIPVKIVRY